MLIKKKNSDNEYECIFVVIIYYCILYCVYLRTYYNYSNEVIKFIHFILLCCTAVIHLGTQ